MVSSTPPLREHAVSGFVELRREVQRLGRKHSNVLLLPVWSTNVFEVDYYRFQRQPNDKDPILDLKGWPKRIDVCGYRNWGGVRPERLRVKVQCATDVNKCRVPIAYAVDTCGKHHNPLCNMQLLAARGFTTGFGWIRVVSTDSDSLNALRRDTLEPLSNKLLMPPPKKWLALGL